MCRVCLQRQKAAGSCNSLWCTVRSPGEAGPRRAHGMLQAAVGPSAVVGCTGSREGVGRDLHLLTGPAVAAVAILPASGVQDNSCGLRPPLELVGGAPPFVSAWSKKGLCWAHPSPRAPCSNGLLPLWQAQASSWTPSWLAVVHWPPQAVFTQPTPVLSLGSELQGLSLSSQPPPAPEGEQTSLSGW